MFPRGLAGHAIAAFVLPKQSVTTSPFANESKNKDGAAITVCSLCNLDMTAAVLWLHDGYLLKTCSSTKAVLFAGCTAAPIAVTVVSVTFLCTFCTASFSMLLLGYL